MSFVVYDLTLLGIFAISLGIVLYRRRKNVKREGLLLLYKTSWGIKLIHRVGEKYQKTLKVLSYISVTIGYFLMAGALYLVARVSWIYVFNPSFVRAIKIPPVMPLVPYLPQAFHLNLPPFYFTYWIIIIAVVATLHEFAHGIFAARSNVKIKSTGFGFFPFFLPVFLAAFVEPDDKQMQKRKVFDQLAVLSAGTFANLLTAIAALGIMIGFFAIAFAPAGVSFNTYPYNVVNVSSITEVGNQSFVNPSYQQVLGAMNSSGLNKIRTSNGNYLIDKTSLEKQNDTSQAILYYDAPAIRANLESVIMAIDGVKITSVNQLGDVLHEYSPGQAVNITVMGNNSEAYSRTITLGENPGNKSQSWLGVAFTNNGNAISQFYSMISLKKNDVYYSSKVGDLGIFIYNLFWWLVIVCISVALLNMLPMGIFDGGRFFYLTVLAIFKKEKIAQIAYKFMTYLILAVLFLVMFFWIWYMIK